MAEPPGDDIAAVADRGHLRAAHADRERVVDVLKAAFVQGRLDQDEFGLRIGRALGSQTYADLAALTADLPDRLSSAQPPKPVRRSTRNRKAVVALILATPVLPALVYVPSVPDGSPFTIPLILLLGILYSAVPTGWLILFHAWLEKRAAAQRAQARHALRATPP